MKHSMVPIGWNLLLIDITYWGRYLCLESWPLLRLNSDLRNSSVSCPTELAPFLVFSSICTISVFHLHPPLSPCCILLQFCQWFGLSNHQALYALHLILSKLLSSLHLRPHWVSLCSPLELPKPTYSDQATHHHSLRYLSPLHLSRHSCCKNWSFPVWHSDSNGSLASSPSHLATA